MGGTDGTTGWPRVLFLLRGYPSVDHLAPLIWLLLEDGRFDVRLAGVNALYDFEADSRVAYFRGRGVRWYDLETLLPWYCRLLRCCGRFAAGFGENPVAGKWARALADRLEYRVFQINDRIPGEQVLALICPDGVDLLVFDHNARRLHKSCTAAVQRAGGKAVAFPHGIFFFTNELRVISQLHRPEGRLDSARQFEYLNRLVVTNGAERDKAMVGLSDPGFAARISVVGSLRYTPRWVATRDANFPAKAYSFPRGGAVKLKILFLCPKRTNNVFWEELVRVVRILASCEDHAVCIKGPAQGNEAANIELRALRLANVDVISDAYDTAALVAWSDVVLWVDTSVFYEAFLQGKPVAHLKYLWCDLMLIDGHPAMWQAHCRDDVHAILDRWREDKTYRPYGKADVEDLFERTLSNVRRDPFDDALALIGSLAGASDAGPAASAGTAGSRIELVSFSEEYISSRYLCWLRDEDVARYIVKSGPSVTMADVRDFARQMMESENDRFFAIVDRRDGSHIGNVRIGPIDRDKGSAGFGILIGEADRHGQGLGAEVMECVQLLAFAELGLKELRFPVVREHEGAVRLYRKTGFTETGRDLPLLQKGDLALEQVEFSMSREQWSARTRQPATT